MRPALVALAAALIVACSKEKPAEIDAAAVPTSAAPTTTSAASAPSASAATDGGALAAAGPAATYAGKYTAAPATYYIPEAKDWTGVKPAKEDGTKLVGDGELSLTVEPDGRVTGTIESGPAAQAVVTGIVEGGTVKAAVRRKEADDGLSGSLLGKVEGDAIEGTMKLSGVNATTIREAKFSAKKK